MSTVLMLQLSPAHGAAREFYERIAAATLESSFLYKGFPAWARRVTVGKSHCLARVVYYCFFEAAGCFFLAVFEVVADLEVGVVSSCDAGTISSGVTAFSSLPSMC